MTYTWYEIFNLTTFEALGLVSKKYTFELVGLGVKTVLVTKGDRVSMLYDDEFFLPIQLNDKNPFEFEDHAVYINADNDVFLGIAVPE